MRRDVSGLWITRRALIRYFIEGAFEYCYNVVKC